MTIVDTFADFVVAVESYVYGDMPDSWRSGQGAFNLLVKIRPDLSEMIRGSEFDPFHSDARLVDFYGYLARHWDDDKS